MGVGIMRDETLKQMDLNSSYTLGYVGKTYSKPSLGYPINGVSFTAISESDNRWNLLQ